MSGFDLDGKSRQIVDKLREIGLDKHVPLPAIVVGGDTSSGKSSLLTAISGLEFPSNSGLTTRCPTEVIMTNSPEISAQVSLRVVENTHGRGPTADVLAKQKMFSRTLKENRSDFGEVIIEATELLTEGCDKNYISPTTIVIKACGPDLCNLTLIDLPGLVAACGQNENDNIINEIKDMVSLFFSSPRTVILCIVPANNDFHNSAILTMAKGCDPLGVRTLGVITKPDIADQGSEPDVIKLARNEKAILELGWHIVKLRSQKDLNENTSCKVAEEAEAKFFLAPPWDSLNRKQTGVPALRARLQNLLAERITSELPRVHKETVQNLAASREELQKLGLPCDDDGQRTAIFHTAMARCFALLEAGVQGRFYDEFFLEATPPHSNNYRARQFPLEQTFRESVLQTRFACTDDYEEGDSVQVWHSGSWPLGQVLGKNGDGFSVQLAGGEQLLVKVDHMMPARGDLLNRMKEARGDYLPGFDGDSVFRSLIAEKLAAWDKPTKLLEGESVKLLNEMLSRIIDEAAPPSVKLLQDYMKKQLSSLVSERAKELHKRLHEHLSMERSRPYTQNHYYTDLYIKMKNDSLRRRLEKLNVNGSVDFEAMMSTLRSQGVGTDSIEKSAAIDLEFRLAAYLKVAAKRVTDTVPQLIDAVFIRPVLQDLKTLQANGPKCRLDEIVVESKSAIKERRELTERIAVLGNAEEVLDKLFASAG